MTAPMPSERDPRLVQLAKDLITEDLRRSGTAVSDIDALRPPADKTRTASKPADMTRTASKTERSLYESLKELGNSLYKSVKELVKSFAKLFKKNAPADDAQQAPSPIEPVPQQLSAVERVRALSDAERAVVAAAARDIIAGDKTLRNAYLDGKLPNAGKLAATGDLPAPEPTRQLERPERDSPLDRTAAQNGSELTPQRGSVRNSDGFNIDYAELSKRLNGREITEAASLTSPRYTPDTPGTPDRSSSLSTPPASPASLTSRSSTAGPPR